ncbi:J domain-containing protein required for chloroplast accumulation response 1 isoform X1 [Rhododendron vialii]|uniref:J domain-containing protein required for chloroplast accumulation response 1 isoform X1 n=1 Tax=Rhododendron vialii TaxID=182163 RepID=UPI00265EA62E|nr:J domain-containing protein required for chloroplast accumulation response 1 isoform X1 [Rhododendron vialii]
MDRLSQGENVLHGYSPKTPLESTDIDFHDVFGGPPQRSSMQEMRYSLNSTNRSSQGEEDPALSLRPRSVGLNEMPVFGEDTLTRRRYPSDDFFDDIFRGDESVGSSRRSNQDPIGSTPGSRVMSPARPLPPRAEYFSRSLSAQFQFSLPAKLTKAIDFPVSASSSRSPHRYKDPTLNAISSLYTPSPPLSRLSSEASQEEDDLKNEIRQSYRPSPLSHEVSVMSKESLHEKKSGELESTDIGSNLKKELKVAEAPNTNGQFHFSIYKWASKGVPFFMPLRGGNSTKSKERVGRCSSSNGRNEDRIEPSAVVEEVVLSMPESKSINKIANIVGNLPGETILSDRSEEIERYSLSETGLRGSTEKGIPMSKEEAKKPELKPLHSMLSDTVQEKGNDEISRKCEGKEQLEKTTVSDSNASVGNDEKKHDEKRNKSNRTKVTHVNELHSPDSQKTSEDNLGQNGAKGKVKDFVKIFNQEAVLKPKIDNETRSQSSRWKSKGAFPADDKECAFPTQTKETNYVHVNKMKTPPNVAVMVDKNIVESEKQQSPLKTRVFNSSENSFGQKDTSTTSTESFHDGPKVTDVNIDDLFQENFVVEELYDDPETGDILDDIKISDAKIRKWLNGKEGNIRSLLSTLQYVLWPGSGWKPVPLMDIIEGSAVKRAYQKALLCLHPDKLQQKGAASHQKHVAERVFDVLQEAWEHFNSLGAT